MLKKLNAWLDTPWTWRSYFKLCGYAMLVYVPYIVWYLFRFGLIPSPKECYQKLKKKYFPEEEV